MTLVSSQNTQEVRRAVEDLARIWVEEQDVEPDQIRTETFFEHGQWWFSVYDPAATEDEDVTRTFSVVDSEPGVVYLYEDEREGGLSWEEI